MIRRLVVLLLLWPTLAAADFQAGVRAYERGDYGTALKEFQIDAEQGDAAAQFNLGVMYQNGKGVPRDWAEAAKWFRRAAEQGDADAQHALGRWYGYIFGGGNDPVEAVKWHRKAAEQGHVRAQYSLGDLYEVGRLGKPGGRGLPQDMEEAVRWYRKAAEQGDAKAQFHLGKLLYYSAKENWLGSARELGIVEEYLSKRGVPNYRDYPPAAIWIRMAAEGGHARAQDFLGDMYKQGHGVPQDYRKALRWYRAAVEQGCASAMSAIGGMYKNGLGVPQDYAHAYAWYNVLSAANNTLTELNRYVRDGLANKMTPTQIEEGQRLSRALHEQYGKKLEDLGGADCK